MVVWDQSFFIQDSTGSEPGWIELTASGGKTIATFTPSLPFASGDTIDVAISGDITDLAGNHFVSDVQCSFDTPSRLAPDRAVPS